MPLDTLVLPAAGGPSTSNTSRDACPASQLSDRDLLVEVVRLAASEREATVALVAVLAEVDARRLYLGEGYSSMFAYCTGRLRLSPDAAYHRIQSARAVRKYPGILESLRDGSLSLSAVALLKPHLTAGNQAGLLAAAHGRSKRQVEVLIRSIAPLPDVRSSLRRVPATRGDVTGTLAPGHPPATTAAAAELAAAPDTPARAIESSFRGSFDDQALLTAASATACHVPEVETSAATCVLESAASGVQANDEASERQFLTEMRATTSGPVLKWQAPPPATVSVLSPDRYRLRVTLSAEGHDRLRRAQDLLRHRIPSGDPAVIVERALALLVEQLESARGLALKRSKASQLGGVAVRQPGTSLPLATVRDSELGVVDAHAPQPALVRDDVGEPAAVKGTAKKGRRAERGDAKRSASVEGDRKRVSYERAPSRRTDRAIPAAVKRAVWLRDEGRCTFVGTDGRCDETGRLEFHHRLPVADGGRATVENLCLHCKAHHRLESERWFGTTDSAGRQLAPGIVGVSCSK